MGAVPAWLAKFRVTDDWADHRARGSLGGVDWAAPAGTPIYAPSDGVVDYRLFADGSSVIRVKRSDGTATEFLHGHLIGKSKRLVSNLTLIGKSDGRRGQPGAGPSTGAHIHAHDVAKSGVRVPPFSTIPNTTPAFIPAGATPSKQRKKITMLPLKIVDGRNLLGGGTRTYTFGPGLFMETTSHKSANSIANLLIGLLGRTPNVTYAELADYARASGTCDPDLLRRIEAAAAV